MKNYDHKEIESKWQKRWEENQLYLTSDEKEGVENFYTLVEFSYPSGNLHVGHWYAFAVTDIFARKKRMEGKNVMFPMGFDAFGLPAENAAIKHKLNPREWTYSNMEHMEKQLRSMGASFDWSRKVVTCDPGYYRWTQWLFLQFLKNGLAEQKETRANWCPSCKTVLANEQVVNGHCERCNSEIEKRVMKQWSLKITDYAEKLLSGLEELDWPEQIKDSQRNWIGKSEGSEIEFKIKDSEESIQIFTTRADTLMGATYVVLAPEHPLVDELKQKSDNTNEISAYQRKAQKKKDIERTAEGKEKTGVELKNIKAVHPISGEELPVWIADYVLASYGTGAVMAVPAHDERDFEFAKKYELPITHVVRPHYVDPVNIPRSDKETVKREVVNCIVEHWSEDKVLVLNWKKQPWKTFVIGGTDGDSPEEAARRELLEETGYADIASIRQLGEPIFAEYFAAHKDENRFATTHMMHIKLASGKQQEISDEEKEIHEIEWIDKKSIPGYVGPVAELDQMWARFNSENELAFVGGGTLVNSGEFDGLSSEEAKKKLTEAAGGEMKATYRLRDWTVSRQRYWGCPIPVIHCDACGAVPVPEKDLPVVLPEIDDFLPNDEGKSPLAKVTEWVHVSCPECGKDAQRETDTLDTFVDSSWYFLRYCDPHNEADFVDESLLEKWMPVDFYSGGAEHTTMHLLYSRFFQKALCDFGLVANDEPFKQRLNRGLIMGPDGNKMSKSKGNVIDPDDVVERLGADTVRTYLAFIGPYNEVGSYPWDPDGIVGVRRFLERAAGLIEKVGKDEADMRIDVHIKKVTEDCDALKFNTAIASMMTLANAMEKSSSISSAQFKTFLQLLAPFAPHITEELWEKIGETGSIHLSQWPTYDESKLVTDTVTIAIQVNGKVRDTIDLKSDAEQSEVEEEVLSREKIQSWLEGKKPNKVIYISGKIINIVI